MLAKITVQFFNIACCKMIIKKYPAMKLYFPVSIFCYLNNNILNVTGFGKTLCIGFSMKNFSLQYLL